MSSIVRTLCAILEYIVFDQQKRGDHRNFKIYFSICDKNKTLIAKIHTSAFVLILFDAFEPKLYFLGKSKK